MISLDCIWLVWAVSAAAASNSSADSEARIIQWRKLPPCGAGWQPNATRFSQNCESCTNCGADPLVRAGRPRPAAETTGSASCQAPAARRGGPPHNQCRRCDTGENEWHWVANLPHKPAPSTAVLSDPQKSSPHYPHSTP